MNQQDYSLIDWYSTGKVFFRSKKLSKEKCKFCHNAIKEFYIDTLHKDARHLCSHCNNKKVGVQ